MYCNRFLKKLHHDAENNPHHWLIEFSKSRFNVSWSEDEAESALEHYLQNNELVLITATTNGTQLPTKFNKERHQFIVGSFIQELQNSNPTGLDYLATVAKGNMLANALFLPDTSKAFRRFQDTALYFDTAFLLFALGYTAPGRSQPCLELLNLLSDTGAQLRCFTHTLGELHRILATCAHLMEQGHTEEPYGPMIETIEYFEARGLSSSYVEMIAERLQNDLLGLHIEVVDTPPYDNHNYVIGEAEITKVLSKRIQQDFRFK